MVQVNRCNCCQIEEMKINSALVFNRLKLYFENESFEEIPVDKPLQILDDNHKVVTEWYPTKWYKCVDCGSIWAFDYPEFPAKGSLYKLSSEGVPVQDSIFYFENRRRNNHVME